MTMNVPAQFVMNMLHATTPLVHFVVNAMKASPVMDWTVRVKIDTWHIQKNLSTAILSIIYKNQRYRHNTTSNSLCEYNSRIRLLNNVYGKRDI